MKSKANIRSFAGSIHASFFKAVVVCMILCSIMPLYSALAVELCDGSSMSVMEGQYNVMNNIWGSCSGVGEQCIEVDPCSTYFQVTYSTHTGGCVASYPAVYKGCHWGWRTIDSNLPARVRTLIDVPFSWSVNTGGATGTWNVAMDVWFSVTGNGTPSGAELMIWLRANGGAGPAGTRVASNVNIGGTTWDVYFADWAIWDYIAYKKVNPADNVSLNLKDFIDDSVSRGFVSHLWYLEAIEAGFEIWSNGTGLTTNSFSTSVTAGPDNNAPAVSITSPESGDKFAAGSNITIDANASDTDGTVTKVEFYQGSIKLGEDASPPYSYTWNNVPTGYYSLTARATDDDGDTTTSSAVNIQVIGGTGAILREWWTGIPGTAVSDLTSNVNYPDKPSGRELITTLEGPTNWADNYGTRIHGYLHPAADGNYTFWIASDDNSELWLSSDENPANASRIAYVPLGTYPRDWDVHPEQQSSTITLMAGQKYYIEVLHKAGVGGDTVAVAWGNPNEQVVIDGVYLSPCCLDFRDFAGLAAKWRLTNCNAGNSWCNGADFNRNGSVLFDDVKLFVESWLEGVE